MSQEQAQPASTSDRSRLRSLIAGFLALLVLASGATLFWLLSQRTGEAADLQRERERAMSVARSFVLRVNTYGPEFLAEDGTMPDYRDSIQEVTSAKFFASFEQSVGLAEAGVSQAGVGRKGEVFSAGVLSIDSDSATALVAGQFVNTYPDPEAEDDTTRVDDVPLPLRLRLELVKVDGEWQVDDFIPVINQADGGTPPGLVPSPGATPEQTPEQAPDETPEPSPSEEATP